MAIHLGRPSPDASRNRPERRRERPARRSRENRGRLPLLLGFAPGGVCPAAAVAGGAVRSYRTISPLPPMPSQAHPDRRARRCVSVALSLGSPPPGVTRHRASVEPGLSSPGPGRTRSQARPSDRLAWDQMGSDPLRVKAGRAPRHAGGPDAVGSRRRKASQNSTPANPRMTMAIGSNRSAAPRYW